MFVNSTPPMNECANKKESKGWRALASGAQYTGEPHMVMVKGVSPRSCAICFDSPKSQTFVLIFSVAKTW